MTNGWRPSRVASVPEVFGRPMTDRPNIDRLWVLHWPRHAGVGSLPSQSLVQLGRSGVLVDTCMRQLLIGTGPRPLIDPACAGTLQIYSGASAYRLLLEIITGLRSAVCGETNVYGQFRRAWQVSQQSLPADITQPLSPFIDALFSDTRRIRQQHLQGVGGNSYGSLARRLLAPARGARVLFVGTGELARSMLPFFRAAETGAWNHRPVAAPAVDQWFSTTQADAAARWAEHIIFTTPADAEHDAGWQAPVAARHGAQPAASRPSAQRGAALDRRGNCLRSGRHPRRCRSACKRRLAATGACTRRLCGAGWGTLSGHPG